MEMSFFDMPSKDMMADRLKLAHTDRALIRHWLVARAHSLSRHADAPCFRGHKAKKDISMLNV